MFIHYALIFNWKANIENEENIEILAAIDIQSISEWWRLKCDGQFLMGFLSVF